MKVYIQKFGEQFAFDGCFSAFEGANHMGMEILFFEDIMEVPANRNNLVVASVEDTIKFFERIGIEVPEAVNIYDIMSAEELKREHSITTLEKLIEDKPKWKPAFIKPFKKTKGCPAGLVNNFNDLNLTFSDVKDKSIEVVVAQAIDIVSEYRCFVNKFKGIVGMKHYQGEFMKFPNVEYIYKAENAIRQYLFMIDAFTIDFGILSDGSTIVIEVNDGWSIGSYGLDGEVYLKFLIARWRQLMNK